jgi:hypothetical protein
MRILALTAISFFLLAPASFAQASLSGESLESVLSIPGQETTFDNFTCHKGGTTTISFHAQGAALGPYSGTFTESGTFTIGPQTDTSIDTRGVGPITAFQATFTIDSDFPVGTVTGTKQLSPTAPAGSSLAVFGSCDPNGSSPPNDVVLAISNPHVLYDAQINAVTGSRTDSGTASVVIRSMPSLPSLITFQEVFNSTEPVPVACADQDGNQDDDCQGEDENGVVP